jgi:ABC-type uncharacterized transport system ATPase subunit
VSLGEVRIDGASTKRILDMGVGYVPEDREHDGLVGSFPLAHNMVLDSINEQPWSRFGLIDYAKINKHGADLIEQFDVRARSADVLAATLSGGNKQSGVAVIVVSTELDEVYALADRIAVMYAGTIAGIVDPGISRDDLGLLMAGAVAS